MSQKEGWKPQTIKTLIGRLVKKKALDFEVEGKRYLYSPLIKRETAVAAENGSFLDRISRGGLAPLLTHLVENHQDLDSEELTGLRDLLREETKKSGANHDLGMVGHPGLGNGRSVTGCCSSCDCRCRLIVCLWGEVRSFLETWFVYAGGDPSGASGPTRKLNFLATMDAT